MKPSGGGGHPPAPHGADPALEDIWSIQQMIGVILCKRAVSAMFQQFVDTTFLKWNKTDLNFKLTKCSIFCV